MSHAHHSYLTSPVMVCRQCISSTALITTTRLICTCIEATQALHALPLEAMRGATAVRPAPSTNHHSPLDLHLHQGISYSFMLSH